jgi:5-methylthioadenosine/S-adenosylhomocysteine deaminase
MTAGTLLRNVRIPNFEEFSVSPLSHVLIKDGRISGIDPARPDTRDRTGDRVRDNAPDNAPDSTTEGAPHSAPRPVEEGPVTEIECDGGYLVPGCVNTHAHTAMTLLRGTAEDLSPEDWFNRRIWIYEKNLTPEDVYLGTLLGSVEMLCNGTTAVADHYFMMENAYRAYRESGIRADCAPAVFGVGEFVEAELQRSLEFLREFRNKDDRITVSLGPHSPYLCPESFLQRVASYADEMGLRMHIHVSETRSQVEKSIRETGRTPVQILYDTGVLRSGTILAHAYYAEEHDFSLIHSVGAGVAHCAKTYMKFADFHDFLPRARASGVPVGLGTDGAASNNTMNIFEVARDAALLAKAATASPEAGPLSQVLPLLFGGGQVLGIENYGTICPGAVADCVVLSCDTPNMQPGHDIFADILYSLSDRNIRTVIVDGLHCVQDGRHLTVDTEALYREVSERKSYIMRHHDGPMQVYDT